MKVGFIQPSLAATSNDVEAPLGQKRRFGRWPMTSRLPAEGTCSEPVGMSQNVRKGDIASYSITWLAGVKPVCVRPCATGGTCI